MSKVNAIKSDAAAWAGLQGIATHSYNMAATEDFAQTIAGTGKEYWITETGDNGPERADDESFAAMSAARFLNDMNHGVTDLIWFIGVSTSDNLASDGDSATKLGVYDKATGQLFKPLKYWYFMQQRTVFEFGTTFRHTTSASEGDMTYTYGRKPAVNVAAGINADSTWAAGIVNDTGIPLSNADTSWHAAQTYNVSLTINELVGKPDLRFAVYRSSAGQHNEFAGLATMHNGQLTLTVNPKQLVSIRACSTVS
jgi:hypothetical protein